LATATFYRGPLAGELVQLERVEERVLVFYSNTLIRELNLIVKQKGKDGGTAALERCAFPTFPSCGCGGWPTLKTRKCKGCLETICKGCLETYSFSRAVKRLRKRWALESA
jgi:hypothetical protein